jgi:hypothetical protein
MTLTTIKRDNMATISSLTSYMTSRHNKIYEAMWAVKSISGNMMQGYWGECKSNGLTNDHSKKY